MLKEIGILSFLKIFVSFCYFFLLKNIKILLKSCKKFLNLTRELDKMNESNTLKLSAHRISFLFSSKKKGEKKKAPSLKHQKYMRLNFLLLNVFLENSKKRELTSSKEALSFFPFFTDQVLLSNNPHLIEIVKQAHSCCIKQDFHLFPFKQFCLRNEFTFHKVIEWRLSKYIKSKEKLMRFVKIMKETPPDAFRHHLVTLLKKEEKSPFFKKNQDEAKKQVQKWELWKHHAEGSSFKISKI